jgi:hypothetical protein
VELPRDLESVGEYFQTIADLDAQETAAQACVELIRSRLVALNIIVAEPTDCVLGDTLGHAPGRSYFLAVDQPEPLLSELRTNGVAFVAKRTVFYSCGVDDITLVCAACAGRFVAGDSWRAAIDEWYANHGAGMLACSLCGAKAAIPEWQHKPPFAFGNLGITFWNWPPLRQKFIDDVAALLDHRVRLVYGKL